MSFNFLVHSAKSIVLEVSSWVGINPLPRTFINNCLISACGRNMHWESLVTPSICSVMVICRKLLAQRIYLVILKVLFVFVYLFVLLVLLF